jgi:purine-cytosine permease-like protein
MIGIRMEYSNKAYLEFVHIPVMVKSFITPWFSISIEEYYSYNKPKPGRN